MTPKKSKGFVLHDELVIDLLESGFTAEDIGVLVIAIAQYRLGNELPDMDKAIKAVWLTRVKYLIDADIAKYRAVCERNRTNGAKGGRPRKTQENPQEPSGLFGLKNDDEKNPKNPISNIKYQISNNTSIEVLGQPPKNKARPGSVEAVREYRQGLGYNGFDAEKFYDYYERNGWVQGRGKPIKDWKAAVRNWHKNDKRYQPRSNNDWLDAIERGLFDE